MFLFFNVIKISLNQKAKWIAEQCVSHHNKHHFKPLKKKGF